MEGREAPRGRVEDGGAHGAVVVCAEGAGEGCGGVVIGDAAAYAGEGVGDGLNEVVEGGGGQVGECLRSAVEGRRGGRVLIVIAIVLIVRGGGGGLHRIVSV